jgi:hypothetical protein
VSLSVCVDEIDKVLEAILHKVIDQDFIYIHSRVGIDEFKAFQVV